MCLWVVLDSVTPLCVCELRLLFYVFMCMSYDRLLESANGEKKGEERERQASNG